MAILLNNHGYDNATWKQEFAQQLPEIPLYVYPDLLKKTDRDRINYAVVWDHPKGDLQGYKNLQAIFSLGAGMEHLLEDTSLPDIPLVPLLDPIVAEDMANYALYWVMNAHRHYDDYHQQQAQQIWKPLEIKSGKEFNVTVLGLGRIGQKLVDNIHHAGFAVTAWDFKKKVFTSNIQTYAGISKLYQSIKNADVVINCLPFNAKTNGLINADFLSQMTKQSTFINISRGAVVDEADLLDALNHDAIKSAVLDVVCKEPLPQQNPLWHHPKVTITPHISGATYARNAASVIVKNIIRMENGKMPEGVFDRHRSQNVEKKQRKSK